jgi:hypothetical protein
MQAEDNTEAYSAKMLNYFLRSQFLLLGSTPPVHDELKPVNDVHGNSLFQEAIKLCKL